MEWIQAYDPLHHAWLSTLAAAVPIVLLLVALGVFEWKAHWAAIAGLGMALAVAVGIYGMPATTALGAALDGAAYGLFPIGWIVVNAVFLYNLTVAAGQFDIVKSSVARLSADRRIQALLVAFSFGAFIEGAAGFGTPVAITAALLGGLGFTPPAVPPAVPPVVPPPVDPPTPPVPPTLPPELPPTPPLVSDPPVPPDDPIVPPDVPAPDGCVVGPPLAPPDRSIACEASAFDFADPTVSTIFGASCGSVWMRLGSGAGSPLVSDGGICANSWFSTGVSGSIAFSFAVSIVICSPWLNISPAVSFDTSLAAGSATEIPNGASTWFIASGSCGSATIPKGVWIPFAVIPKFTPATDIEP